MSQHTEHPFSTVVNSEFAFTSKSRISLAERLHNGELLLAVWLSNFRPKGQIRPDRPLLVTVSDGDTLDDTNRQMIAAAVSLNVPVGLTFLRDADAVAFFTAMVALKRGAGTGRAVAE